MQQAPKHTETGKGIRQLFIARPGCKIIQADLSQIELRIMALIAKDKTMIKAFSEGRDPHKLMAAKITGKPFDEVTLEERSQAKSANFGFQYGASAAKFRKQVWKDYRLKLTDEDAEHIRSSFFDLYPGIDEYHKEIKDQQYYHNKYWLHTAQKGVCSELLVFTTTLLGRKRVWKIPKSSEMVNTPIQGLGADLLKATMIELYAKLPEDVKMLACVHDEIVCECPQDKAEEVALQIKDIMETIGSEILDPIPCIAETKVLDTWGGNLLEALEVEENLLVKLEIGGQNVEVAATVKLFCKLLGDHMKSTDIIFELQDIVRELCIEDKEDLVFWDDHWARIGSKFEDLELETTG